MNFQLCGSGILGVGIWLRVEKGDYVQFTDYEFVTASNLAIAAGVIVVIVTFLGCVGALKEMKILLLLVIHYSKCCVIIFLLLHLEGNDLTISASLHKQQNKLSRRISYVGGGGLTF